MRAILLLLCLTTTLSARIGDTLAELEKRFGKSPKIEMRNELSMLTFDLGTLVVTVHLVNGTSAMEGYIGYKEDEAMEFLKSQSYGELTETTKPENKGKFRQFTNGKDIRCSYLTSARMLHIKDIRYDKYKAVPKQP